MAEPMHQSIWDGNQIDIAIGKIINNEVVGPAEEAAKRAEQSAANAKASEENAETFAINADAAKTAIMNMGASATSVSTDTPASVAKQVGPDGAVNLAFSIPKGKDATIDATLTQANQAAEAKVTGDALNKLSLEKADEVQWVDIETITMPDTAPLSVDVEPDGTPYNFIAISIDVKTGFSTNRDPINFIATIKSGGTVGINFLNGFIPKESYNMYGWGELVKKQDGSWFVRSTASSDINTVPIQMFGESWYLRNTDYSSFTVVSLKTNKPLPKDTVIKIRAVRA